MAAEEQSGKRHFKRSPITKKVSSLQSKRTVRVKAKSPAKPRSVISDDQWNLPAGFKADGSFATLADVIRPQVATLSIALAKQKSKHDLILERLKLQPDYPTISILGMGSIDRETAISEVKKKTDIGKMIEESEQNTINILIARAKNEQPQ